MYGYIFAITYIILAYLILGFFRVASRGDYTQECECLKQIGGTKNEK